MSNVDPGIAITLGKDSVCRLCGRPLIVGQWVYLDAFGYRHPSDCSGDHS